MRVLDGPALDVWRSRAICREPRRDQGGIRVMLRNTSMMPSDDLVHKAVVKRQQPCKSRPLILQVRSLVAFRQVVAGKKASFIP